jgi:ubiquinol-cytochrome c reductase cytochrome b/c1 subunit
VPEWYFLPFYAILRAIPNKLLGVIALASSICILFFLPLLDTSKVRSTSYRSIYKWFFLAFVATCIILGYLGSQPPEGWYLVFGRIFTAYYFLFFLVVMPVVGRIETPKRLPGSITESVLGRKTPWRRCYLTGERKASIDPVHHSSAHRARFLRKYS